MATAKAKEQQRIARIRNHPANKKALAGMKRKYVRKAKADPTPPDVQRLAEAIDRMGTRIDILAAEHEAQAGWQQRVVQLDALTHELTHRAIAAERAASNACKLVAKLEKDTHDQIDGMMRRIDALQLFVNRQADDIIKLQFPAVAAFTDFDVNKLDTFMPNGDGTYYTTPKGWGRAGGGKTQMLRDLFDNTLDLTGIPGQADKPKAPDWRSVVMESSRKENERLRLEGVRKDELIERQRKTITKLCTMVPHDVLKKAMEE